MGGKTTRTRNRVVLHGLSGGFHSHRTDLRKDMACVCTCVCGGLEHWEEGECESVCVRLYVYMRVYVRRKE